MYAPTSGKVPNTEQLDLSAFISDVDLALNADTLNMAVGVRDYVGINDYDDLLRSKVKRKAEDMIQDKWNRSDRRYFAMTMSGVGIDNIVEAMPTKA